MTHTNHTSLIAPSALELEVYHTRRIALMTQMQTLTGGGIAIIHTAPEVNRNADSHYPYRYDSDFFYLTGFTEPEAVLILNANTHRSIVLCRTKNTEREIWDGYRFGVEMAKEVFQFDETYPIETLSNHLPGWISNQCAVYSQIGLRYADKPLKQAYNTVAQQIRQGLNVPEQLRDVRPLIAEQRLIKDEAELITMRRAAYISALAHNQAMQTCYRLMHNKHQPLDCLPREYHLEAELLHVFRQHGAQFPAYTSIVATGGNACVLHYRADNTVIKNNDLVLIDAGCELNGYASDITRTFPANGTFTDEQKTVYELVLHAQTACLNYLSPKHTFNEYNDAATRILSQGLIDLGWLKGSLDSVLELGSYKQFYMHKAGHWLGLDVHDCGDYRVKNNNIDNKNDNRPWRMLQKNMVLTVEPGLYIRPAKNVPEAFWNIGIRIEDDAIITETGYELITRDTPVTVNEIEAMMRKD